jgi:hypothetical protein
LAQNTLECGGSAAAFEIATAATKGSSAKRLGDAVGPRRRDTDTAAWMRFFVAEGAPQNDGLCAGAHSVRIRTPRSHLRLQLPSPETFRPLPSYAIRGRKLAIVNFAGRSGAVGQRARGARDAT